MSAVDDLVTEIRAAGFDVTPTEALTVLDRRHKKMCERAKWFRQQRTYTTGPTAPGTPYSELLVGEEVVEAFSIEAWLTEGGETGVMKFRRTQDGDRPAMVAGTLHLAGPGGVFTELDPSDETDTTPSTLLMLYPRVGDDVDVFVYGAFTPPDLNSGETAGGFVRVPQGLREELLAGCYASLLMKPGEARPDLAATQEQLFSSGCVELEQRARRRYRTRGPAQIRLG